MAQLDRLLAVLVSRRGDSLRLVQDEPALLVRGAETQALTRVPVTPAQMLAIVREVAPGDTEQRVERGEGAQFEYTLGADAFVGRVHREQGRLTLDVTPRPSANGNGHGNGNGNGHRNATPGGVTAVAGPRVDTDARARIDGLLRSEERRVGKEWRARRSTAQ